MQRMKKVTAVAIVGVFATVLFGAGSCDSDPGDGQKSETKTQQSNYDKLVAKDPAHTMANSPTRQTINRWIDTWNKPDALAYVYFQSAEGKVTGYYVMKGLPVSYCTSLTPNYKLLDEGDAGQLSVPAPGIDGVYYSGGDCNRYYGFDATTGSYVEFTVGLGINLLVYNQPLPAQKIPGALPLGPTNVSDGKPATP